MQVLVTGGAGFIGSNLVEFHLGRGDQVRVVDDLSTGAAANLQPFAGHPHLRFDHADVVGWAGLREATANADRIYHLAAVAGMFRVLGHPDEINRVNVMGADRVLREAARAPQRPQVVLASSSCVYGLPGEAALREDAPLTISPADPLALYAISKLTNELHAAAYFEKHGVKVVCARLFNAVGPGQRGTYGFVMPRFVQQALTGDPITVFGDGRQVRSFCDVRDTVAMLDLLAGSERAWGQVVNVGNDQPLSIGALATLVKERASSRSLIEHVPFSEAYGTSSDPVAPRRPALDRLRALTGYQHRFRPQDMVDRFIERFRQRRL